MSRNENRSKRTAYILSNDPGNAKKGYASTNVIALTISRNLGREGVPVVRLHPNPYSTDLSSKYVEFKQCPDCVSQPEAALDFLIALGKNNSERLLLFPATDDCSKFAASHHKEIEKYFLVPQPGGEVTQNIINKRKLYETAASVDVDIPDTCYPETSGDIALVSKKMKYPCVIKPTASADWKRQEIAKVVGGEKAVVAKNPQDLAAWLEKILPLSKNLMVQEIIGGGDVRLITLQAYFNRSSEPLAFCIRKKIRQYPPGFGYCSFTETIESPEVRDLSFRLLKKLQYTGLAGVEFKLDPATNKYKLIEINTRAVQTIGIAAASGVNLPYIAYEDMLGNQVERRTHKAGVKWMYETIDFLTARRLIARGELTYGQWLSSLRGTTAFALHARDDMRPFIQALVSFVKRGIASRLRRHKTA